MDAAINLIIWVLLFAIAGWGMYTACVRFELPKPVLWVCGVILLIGILIFLAKVVNGGLPTPFYRSH
jgi:hypothetical protein